MKPTVFSFLNWLFALVFSSIGLINVLSGNDPGFGIFILLLSLLFYPPFQLAFLQKVGRPIPKVLLLIMGLFIVWASLGVGELVYKTQVLMRDYF